MKKLMIFAMLLGSLLLCGCSRLSQPELFTYDLNPDGTAVVTGYTGSEPVLRIPAKLGGAKVTAIGPKAFAYQQTLERVVIPRGVTVIHREAFVGCTMLTQVKLPDTVTVIETSAFSRCISLTEAKLPKGLTHLGSVAFGGCEKLGGDLKLPETLVEMGDFAFDGTAIESVTIPGGVRHTPDSSFGRWFGNCAQLKIVIYEEGAEELLLDDFGDGMMTLETLMLPASLTQVRSRSVLHGDQVWHAGEALPPHMTLSCWTVQHVHVALNSAAHEFFQLAQGAQIVVDDMHRVLPFTAEIHLYR